MKFNEKNIIFSIMLLLGILLNYSVYMQYTKAYASYEMTSHDNSTSNGIYFDSEIHEDDQNSDAIAFLPEVEIKAIHRHFHVPFSLNVTFHTVWQPPKLS